MLDSDKMHVLAQVSFEGSDPYLNSLFWSECIYLILALIQRKFPDGAFGVL